MAWNDGPPVGPGPSLKTCPKCVIEARSKTWISNGLPWENPLVNPTWWVIVGCISSWKIWVKLDHFPNFRGTNQISFKPPPRYILLVVSTLLKVFQIGNLRAEHYKTHLQPLSVRFVIWNHQVDWFQPRLSFEKNSLCWWFTIPFRKSL